jgi:hypothetical protein
VRRDGTLGSLFVDRKSTIPVGRWLYAKLKPTPGLKPRKGFHSLLKPVEPHLKTDLKSGERRRWFVCQALDYETIVRPEAQGGTWVVSERLKILEPYE